MTYVRVSGTFLAVAVFSCLPSSVPSTHQQEESWRPLCSLSIFRPWCCGGGSPLKFDGAPGHCGAGEVRWKRRERIRNHAAFKKIRTGLLFMICPYGCLPMCHIYSCLRLQQSTSAPILSSVSSVSCIILRRTLECKQHGICVLVAAFFLYQGFLSFF